MNFVLTFCDILGKTTADKISSSRPLHFNDGALISADFKAIDKKHFVLLANTDAVVHLMDVTYTLYFHKQIKILGLSIADPDVTLRALLTGQCLITCNDHLFKINITKRPLCTCVNLQSPGHILFANLFPLPNHVIVK